MTNLLFQYWNSKFDKPTDMDFESIKKIFSDDSCFNKDEKIILAEILLTSRITFSNQKDLIKASNCVDRYMMEYAVDELFYISVPDSIQTWKYDYQSYLQIIPEQYIKEVIEKTYYRLGYEINDEDYISIKNSCSIYSLFIFTLKEEANNKYIMTNDRDNFTELKYILYLNMFIIYNKLGFDGTSPYILFSKIGNSLKRPSLFPLKPFTETEKLIIELTKKRSQNRTYPTPYEKSSIIKLIDK